METPQARLLGLAMVLSVTGGCHFFGHDSPRHHRSGEDPILTESIIPTKEVRAFLAELFDEKETGI